MFIAFGITGFVTIFTGLCYAEFSGRMPFNGSAYSYAYTCVGEYGGWILGWNTSLSYGISGGLLAKAWA